MSYLLDKKTKRKKVAYITLIIVILVTLFYFRMGIFGGLAYVGHGIFRPIIVAGNNIGGKFSNLNVFFISKSSLIAENRALQDELKKSEFKMVNYDSILAENASLKNILGRKGEQRSLLFAAILGKPNQNLYDALILDVGSDDGVQEDDIVFASGHIPVGRIVSVHPNSSKVILFSNPGEKTQSVITIDSSVDSEGDKKNILVELIGRGGGNFEITLPRDLTLRKGDQVVLPGITPYVLGIVETIISDPREPFVKALLVSLVNVGELKFLEVEI